VGRRIGKGELGFETCLRLVAEVNLVVGLLSAEGLGSVGFRGTDEVLVQSERGFLRASFRFR